MDGLEFLLVVRLQDLRAVMADLLLLRFFSSWYSDPSLVSRSSPSQRRGGVRGTVAQEVVDDVVVAASQ